MKKVIKKFQNQKVKNNRLGKLYDLNNIISEEHIDRILNNAGTVKNYGDFQYDDGGTVPVGKEYHIHYSRIGKTEVYMTGNQHNETSLVIYRKQGSTSFGKYIELTGNSKSMTYLNKSKFKVTNKNRKVGIMNRYFVQQGNSINSPIFEISKSDFNKKTPFYKKIKMDWSLDINRQMMINKNIDEINRVVENGFKSLEFSLNPSEGYIDGDELPTDEKLNKLKILLPKKKFNGTKKRGKKKKKKNFLGK